MGTSRLDCIVLTRVGFGYEVDPKHAKAIAYIQLESSFFALCFRCVLGHNRYQMQRIYISAIHVSKLMLRRSIGRSSESNIRNHVTAEVPMHHFEGTLI